MTDTSDVPIPDLPAVEIARRVRAREISAAEALDACMERVERLNPELNAIVTLNPEARKEAEEVDQRIAAGDVLPLAGVTAGIKDVTEVKGLRTTYGSPLFDEHEPAEDAEVVTRLRRAGAVILGKTNTPEFAAGGNTWNEVFGRTRNPWNPERSAGGSTGGGAVGLVTGMLGVAQGTDLGGSLRIPSAFCGCVGIRPSVGLVPTWPSTYLWDSYQVTGPMGRTVADAAAALQVMAGPSDRSPLAQPIDGRDFLAAALAGPHEGLRIAYCPDIAGIGVDPEVEAVCREAAFALEEVGAAVEEIELDLSWARRPFLAIRGLWFVAQLHDMLDRVEEFGVNVRNNTKAGLETEMRAVGEAERVRSRLWETMREMQGRYDHLLTPTMAVPPFPVEENFPRTIAGREMETYIDWIAPTFVLNMTGMPVASVPAGLDPEGMPVGLQIVGRPRGEEGVLALSAAVERLRPIGRPSIMEGSG